FRTARRRNPAGRAGGEARAMMIDRRLVARLQAMKPGERLILPAKYSAELNVRNLLAAAGAQTWDLVEYIDAQKRSRWIVGRVGP
ncbi:MAG: hypothetical protein ACK6EB_15360, partial [Planctomyces sp.]